MWQSEEALKSLCLSVIMACGGDGKKGQANVRFQKEDSGSHAPQQLGEELNPSS